MHKLHALLYSLPMLVLFGSGVAPVSTGLYAQAISGDLVGTVADATGAVVPSGKVTAVNLATSLRVTASTNASGLYRLANLLPGNYDVSAESAGFNTSIV